jgi:molybdenum ABC transporter molybdate-binding protein
MAALCLVVTTAAARAEELRVLAAGSLREAIGAIAGQYGKATGVTVTTGFGPSGLLRERIEKGERADLFASADIGNPLTLLEEGRAVRVVMFTRNALCGFAAPKVGLGPANFLDRLLDPAVKLGTSIPKADPGGDYTWAMFHRAEVAHPGAFAILDKKAQKIVGGPTNTPTSGNPAVDALSAGRIDVMIGYCSGRARMRAAIPDIEAVEVPATIAASPEYGLAVLKGAAPHTADLALFMLSPAGQQVFARSGFAPVGLPRKAQDPGR